MSSLNEPEDEYQVSNIGENYMQYSSVGAYDDDKYSMYSQASYEIPEERAAPEVVKPAPSRKSFEVLNKTAIEVPVDKYPTNSFACPACGLLAISSCNCPYRDRSCPRGHNWYVLNNKKQIGISPSHKQ